MALDHPDQEERQAFNSSEDLGFGQSFAKEGWKAEQSGQLRRQRLGRAAAAEVGEGGSSWGEEGSPAGRAIEKARAAERPGLRPTGRPFPPQPLGGLLHAAEGRGQGCAPIPLPA